MTKTEICCQMRRKVVVAIIHVRSEEECGIADLDMGGFINWDLKVPSGKPVVQIRYCPWCGELVPPTSVERITDIQSPEKEDDGDCP